MTPARTVALLGLGFGIYLLGIATSLLLVRFNEYPDAWQRYATALVAGLAMLVIVTSAAWILKSNDTAGADRFDGGSNRADQIVSTAESTSRPARGGSPPNTNVPPSGARSEEVDSGTAPDEDVQGCSDDDSAVEGREPEHRQGMSEAATSPPPSIAQNGGPHDPPVGAGVQADDLIDAWEVYRREGDGHFNARGLQEQLNARNLSASVRDDERVGTPDCVLVVETPSPNAEFYVLPSFTKSPRKVSMWFDDHSDGALTGRIEKVLKVAEGRWTKNGMIDAIQKGIVA